MKSFLSALGLVIPGDFYGSVPVEICQVTQVRLKIGLMFRKEKLWFSRDQFLREWGIGSVMGLSLSNWLRRWGSSYELAHVQAYNQSMERNVVR
jgi:hypothetical protein